MAKSILISIKPRYVADILNHKKTIEVRKTKPKCDLPIDVYIYCTKEEELFYSRDTQKWFTIKNRKNIKRLSNGVVKSKFTLNKVEEIRFDDKEIQRKACLAEDELFDYLFVNEPYHEDMKKGYAWHISNLVIFDEPKELREFKYVKKYRSCNGCPHNFIYFGNNDEIGLVCRTCQELKPLTKAPQSYCYIETEN